MLGMKLLEMGKRYEDKPFPKKAFHGGGQTFFRKFMGGYFTWVLMIRSCNWRKSFTNAFSSNLNSVNLKIFPGHGERHTGK